MNDLQSKMVSPFSCLQNLLSGDLKEWGEVQSNVDNLISLLVAFICEYNKKSNYKGNVV